MTTKKTIKSIRIDAVLSNRIDSYCKSSGMKEAEALRHLLELGLACESLNVFATPVGSLIRDVVEAEFHLLRQEMSEQSDALEERVAKVCSRGTKYSLYGAVLLTDVSRSIIPAWNDTPVTELWEHYSKCAGELQTGRSYKDMKENT